ncbi:MAG: tail fiber domain-containing protein [Anaerolineae bacterium]|nr:tail fiber domain-containing protein [Gloeobacterales cyanobacterium ES-bin-313]
MKIGHRFLALTGLLSLSFGVLATASVHAQNVQPLQYVAVPPCRVVDTRFTPGAAAPLIANTVRAFRATGTDFSGQGGTSGSCNIPVGATSVFFNFTVTGASASGFLTAYPYNQNNSTQPNSSVINYSTTTSTPAIANGIAVLICDGGTTVCANDFYVSANVGTTNLVVDVVGYYAPDIGNNNTATGRSALFSNTTGSSNTANGLSALQSNTTGSNNIASGIFALAFNTTGSNNIAIGSNALFNNATGNSNTAIGLNALFFNTLGFDNTANGNFALRNNTTGARNTATGRDALFSNTIGNNNTATGIQALVNNTTGEGNTAIGADALESNTTGSFNTANGNFALPNNTTGDNNIATGRLALNSNTTGNNNVALGSSAGFNLTTGSNNVDIANLGVAGEGGVIRIGTPGTQTRTFISGINGVTASGGVQVFINANGQLGTLTSSRRFKRDINNLGSLSDRLLKLRPVSFRYKQATEQGEHPLQYGLIAEEVAKVFPELVQYDKEGKPITVYYHLLTPLLLGEVQRQQAQLVSEKSQLTALRSKEQSQQVQLTALHSDNQRLRQQLSTLQAQQEQMLKAVSTRLNNLERAVEVNGKAPQAPATVLTAVPSTSR